MDKIKEDVKYIIMELIRDELKDWDYTNTYAEENRTQIRVLLQDAYDVISKLTYDELIYGVEINEQE